ncbi:MAG: hypothetical protein GC192_03580 [Bacteroidetes bacterium]|nr:hypothetical protein [Bacteroidota bacterium]
MNKPLHSFTITLVGLFLFFINANAQCAGNLINNPGFEGNLTGWTIVGPSSLSADAHSGSHAADLTSASYGSIGYVLPATPGTSYTMSAWTKYTCSVELRFLSSSWNKLPGSVEQQSVSVFYQQTTLNGTAPAGTAYVYVFFAKDGNGSFLVDDVCLTTGGPACIIVATTSNTVCDDNGTPNNPNDDLFGFTVNANFTGTGGGTGYLLNIPQTNQTFNGTYGTALNIQNVPISVGSLTLNVTDISTYQCSATATVVPPPPCSVSGLPDLSGFLHEFINGNFCFTAPGGNFGFLSMQINNMGTVAASAFKVKFYFSTDSVLSADDLLWDTEDVPSLGLFNNSGPAFISPTQTVPANLAYGHYYIITTIDEDDQVTESNETNNIISPLPVQIGASDVTMQGYWGVPASVVAGGNFTVQLTAKYHSNGFVQPTGTGFAVDVVMTDLSPNQTIGTVNFTLSEFSSSNTVTKSVVVNVPTSLVAGTYNLRFRASAAFCEIVNSNNWLDKSISVTSGPGGSSIDLELAMQQTTANPVIYSNYTTTATLVNKGPQAATGVKVKWTKPTGVVYTGGNEFVASQGSFNPNGDQIWTVGNIPANSSATLTVSYFLLQNGAPVTYAQVIAADQPDVDSQPNNGTPPTPNEDDEATSGGSAPPVLTPDLTISNLEIPNPTVQPGQVLGYYFDLANIGNGNAPQDFIVRAWISTDPIFNTSGVQDGIVPTGNFIAGFSVTEVPGASTLPTNLTPGQYYLHLWVDADQQVDELNENNNTVTKGFLVIPSPGPGVCDDLIGAGTIKCIGQDANGLAEVYYNTPNGYRLANLDNAGQVATDQSAGTAPVFPVFRISNGNFEKLENNVIVFSIPIPTALSSQYSGFFSFTSFNDGYIIFAFSNVNYGLYAIRTDANFVAQQTVLRGVYSYSGMHIVGDVYQISPTRLAFIESYNSGGTVSDLKMMDETLNDVYSTNLHSPNYYGAGASLYPIGCGNYMVKVSLTFYCHRGACYSMYYREGHFTENEFVTAHLYSTGLQSSMGFGSGYHNWELNAPDGSIITASYNVSMISGVYINTNVVKVVKTQGGTTIWTKYIKLSDASSVRRIALSGDELVFLSEKNNAIFVEAMNCVEPADPQADLSIIVVSGTSPTTAEAGGTGNIYPFLINLGTAPATDFDLKLVLSTDNVYSPATDIVIGNVSGLNHTPGIASQQSISYALPSSIATGTYQFMLVADASNVVSESNESNNIVMSPVNVIGGTTPPVGCAAINILPGTNQLAISDFSAPHVLIKVFNPNWTLAYQCLDDCTNPLIINNLNAGIYHLQIKLIDNGWGEICYLEQDVNVNSVGSSNGTAIYRSENRLRLSFDRFYPSPASYLVTADIFSPLEQATTLEFYDQLGRPVHTMKLQLDKGNNAVPVLVYDWKSGAYNVIARGDETALPAYGRFLKVWEE